jgi:hypothetical protein
MDDTFLREKAYPWMDQIVSTIVKLLDEKDGKLYFQLSVSAEIFDAAPRAYLKPNSNQDLALLRWGFEAMAEMAEALGKQDDVKRWKVLRGKLDGLHIDKDHSLMFSSNEPFNEAHRHHAHAMAIHPFATLNIDGTDKDRQIIDATIKRMVKLGGNDPQGYGWCGFTYSWFSSMLARTGYPELALENLIYFERAFTVRNGFHVCGDMLGTGLTNYVWRSYTLEGNFGAMEAVHDMLLQSWPVDIAKDPTPVIRIFPAMPWKWHDASFTDLRAEGGFIVSAERHNNATTSFSVKAVIDGELRLRDNFGGVKPKFNRKVKKVGRDFVIKLKKGQTLTGKLAKPKNIPPQPKDSTEAEKRIRRIESLALAKDPERLAANVDSAADVYEGSYAVSITGVDQGAHSLTADQNCYPMPAGNHSIKFQYKGDLAEAVIILKGAAAQDPAPTTGTGVAMNTSTTVTSEKAWVISAGKVDSYSPIEIRFTVDKAGLGEFWVGSKKAEGTGQ